MIVDLIQTKDKELKKASICILGGGVAGLVLAQELSSQLTEVVVLESGAEEFNMQTQQLYEAEGFPHDFPNPLSSRLRYLGGSSNHWQNNTTPLSPIDFEPRSWVENSGWPISFGDIAPYYDKAASYCGTAPGGYNLNYWAGKLSGKDLVKESKILTTNVAQVANPPVRFFSKLKNDLTAMTNVTIIKNANVVDILFDEQQNTVNKIYIESEPGDRFSIAADIFVMCFGGMENPRLLLEFNDKYNNGLGNQGDCVGRYFMDHPVVRAAHFHAQNDEKFSLYKWSSIDNRLVKGFFQLEERLLTEQQLTNIRIPLIERSNYALSDGISSYHSITNALSNFEVPEDFGEHIYNLVTDFDMVAEAIARESLDVELFEHANQFGGFELQVMIEQSPERHNRIKLGQRRDRYGIRKLIVDWQLSDNDKKRMWKGLEFAAKEVGALSLGRIRLLREREDQIWNNLLGFGAHHMGTTRMSESSTNGVVDSNQKVFGTRNFYVGGSSVFATGGHVPPTLTITAMTIRLAKHLLGEINSEH